MPFKDIIVHLDRGPGCTARFMAAIDLARRHGATLKGLYPVNHPYYAPEPEPERAHGAVRDFFLIAASKAQVAAEWLYADWGVVGVSPGQIIVYHAHTADLVVIGQPPPDAHLSREQQELPERVILGSGRPVMIFPADGTHYTLGQRVMLAWRGGRESTRALHDAMPLLDEGAVLEIVAVAADEEDRVWQRQSLTALDRHLSLHGITATTEIIPRGKRRVADVLLDHAGERGASLLVMGGFTHSARGLPVFGDVAKGVLRRMTLPILISH